MVPKMELTVPSSVLSYLELTVPKLEQTVPDFFGLRMQKRNSLFLILSILEQKVPINIYAELFVPLNK